MHSTIIYGIDYTSNLDIFNNEGVEDKFYSVMSHCLGIDSEVLSEIALGSFDYFDDSVPYSFRLDYIERIINYLCFELQVSDEQQEAVDYLVCNLTIDCFFDTSKLKDDVKVYSVRDNYELYSNTVIGIDMYLLLSKDKERIKGAISQMYKSVEHLLKPEVTLLDFINRFRYHSIVFKNEEEVLRHTISDVI